MARIVRQEVTQQETVLFKIVHDVCLCGGPAIFLSKASATSFRVLGVMSSLAQTYHLFDAERAMPVVSGTAATDQNNTRRAKGFREDPLERFMPMQPAAHALPIRLQRVERATENSWCG